MSAEPNATPPGYEVSDARPKGMAVFTAALALFSALALALGAWLATGFTDELERAEPEPHPMRETQSIPAGPLLQAYPPDELTRHREVVRRQLEGYEWIDRDAGVVQIPIEHAMELVLERGLPTRADAGGDDR